MAKSTSRLPGRTQRPTNTSDPHEDARKIIVVAEELGRHCSSTAMCFGMHSVAAKVLAHWIVSGLPLVLIAPLIALMAAASATTTLRVGTIVIDNDYRHPVLLARAALAGYGPRAADLWQQAAERMDLRELGRGEHPGAAKHTSLGIADRHNLRAILVGEEGARGAIREVLGPDRGAGLVPRAHEVDLLARCRFRQEQAFFHEALDGFLVARDVARVAAVALFD